VDILLKYNKINSSLKNKIELFSNTRPLKTSFISIQIIYFFAICAYLFNENSRNTLQDATSSYLGNNLVLKILLIICFYVFTSILVYFLCKNTKSVKTSDKSSFVRYVPGLLFVTFNFIPAFLQYFHDYAYINVYYRILQVSNKFPNFIDLRQTLGFITNEKISKIGDEGLIYPTIILKLRLLKRFFELDYSVLLIAFMSTVLLAWVIFDISKNFSRLQIFISSIIVVSPPFLLLVDRQNIDLLILVLLYFSAKILNKNLICNVLGLLFVLIASALKIYPFFILVYLFVNNIHRRIKYVIFSLIILFFIFIGPDLFNIYKFGVKDMAGTIGMPVLMSHFKGLSVSQISFSFTFLVFVLAQLICTYWLFKPKELLGRLSDSEKTLFFYGIVIFLGTMLISTNYLYRLVFLIFFLPIVMKLSVSPFLNISGWFLILASYLSPRSTGLLFNLYLFPFIMVVIFTIIDEFRAKVIR